MSENMKVYEQVRAVPPEALKAINGGRLKGMSDINPMWRIKMLTEMFGMCGIGWKTEITDRRLEHGSGDEVVCFVDILLYVKVDGEWSAPIPGMGGSSFVTMERNGLYTSDECFKMAYTDAISVACKSLGFAADVYFAKDRTKYSDQEDKAPQSPQGSQNNYANQPNHNTQMQPQDPSSAPASPNRNSVLSEVASGAQLGMIGRLKNEKKISDDDYRELLVAKFNLSSSKELSKKQASEFIKYLQDAV
ncbi:hypothetical protein [Paenibacillus sp. NEAU-GSW1]|uniref:hypothetical protein n=1 Tax=Paenibacillus sp. NEAU-GSW1 TaxID=2682486 RepID=UPI0012E1DAE6|nr:hypothetical protein [Paenibacillus sp. NEAU-GSW1]MUT66048.1 hypothetical protein [Paenibacillus sp. NEAU-GSW1]